MSTPTDTERLDWLESLPERSAFGRGPSGFVQVFSDKGTMSPSMPTLREAIDAAITKATQP